MAETTTINLDDLDDVSLVFTVQGKDYKVDPYEAIEWIQAVNTRHATDGSRAWLSDLAKEMVDRLGMPLVSQPMAAAFWSGVIQAIEGPGPDLKKNTGEPLELGNSTVSTSPDGPQPSNGHSTSTSPG